MSDRSPASWDPKRRLQRIAHIVEHAEAVREALKRTSHSAFLSDRLLEKASCYDILCISEAVTRLVEMDPGIVARRPSIPWRQIADMGNILRHEYGRFDVQLVWDTVTGSDLEGLLDACLSESTSQ